MSSGKDRSPKIVIGRWPSHTALKTSKDEINLEKKDEKTQICR